MSDIEHNIIEDLNKTERLIIYYGLGLVVISIILIWIFIKFG